MNAVLMISSDCHSGTLGQYQEYMEAEYREAYADFIGSFGVRLNKDNVKDILGRAPFFFYPDTIVDEYHGQIDERQAWAAAPSAERLSILEREGYVGEIIFPDAAVPFSGQFGGFGGYGGLDARTVELALAGQRAYNRRLADLIDPARQVGCAVVSYADVDAAVATVHKAAASGMRAVLLDGVDPSFPVFADPIIHPKYEPMWSAIEETGLVAQFHVGAGCPFPYYGQDIPREIAQIEVPSWGHRVLWWLIWGGILERHPRMRCAFTEMGTAWVAQALRFMDWQWDGLTASRYARRDMTIPLKPSEYWKRQCFAGASLMSFDDLEARDFVDPSTIMYGTDYAHAEGTWSRTHPYLRKAFSETNCSEAEVRAICGENAARCYGLDLAVLGPIADRVGPTVESLLTADDEGLDEDHFRVLTRPDFIGM